MIMKLAASASLLPGSLPSARLIAPARISDEIAAANAVASAPATSPGQAVWASSASEAAKTIAPIAARTAIVGQRSASRPRASMKITTTASSVTKNQVAPRKS